MPPGRPSPDSRDGAAAAGVAEPLPLDILHRITHRLLSARTARDEAAAAPRRRPPNVLIPPHRSSLVVDRDLRTPTPALHALGTTPRAPGDPSPSGPLATPGPPSGPVPVAPVGFGFAPTPPSTPLTARTLQSLRRKFRHRATKSSVSDAQVEMIADDRHAGPERQINTEKGAEANTAAVPNGDRYSDHNTTGAAISPRLATNTNPHPPLSTPTLPPMSTIPLADDSSRPHSVRRQRSFLRSITNHASISALRNRTWKRKAAAAIVAPRGDEENKYVSATAPPASKSKSVTGSLTMRGRLRKRSVKNSQSVPAIEMPPVPVLVTVDNKHAPPPKSNTLTSHSPSFFARPDACISNLSVISSISGPSVRPPTPKRAASTSSVLNHNHPPPSPTMPFLRRLRNRPPTEVALEFGTKGSPQSDRVVRRTDHKRDPSPSPLSHRRYRSEDVGSSSASAAGSRVSSMGRSLGRSLVKGSGDLLPSPSAYHPLNTPISDTDTAMFEQENEKLAPVEPSQHLSASTSTHATETTQISLGSFDIDVLDRLLESERVLMDAERLGTQVGEQSGPARSPSTSTRSSATSSEPTKHSEGFDAQKSLIPHSLIPARQSDTFRITQVAEYDSTMSEEYFEEDSELLSELDSVRGSIRSPPSLYIPPRAEVARGTTDDTSGLGSRVDDDNTVAFRVETGAQEELADTEARTGILRVEERTDSGHSHLRHGDTPTLDRDPSPLDTNLATPTEPLMGSILSTEHERAWAAFANLQDDDEDFQPVTDEERFLSLHSGGQSSNSSQPRHSWGESEDSFGSPHPCPAWPCSQLSTIEEASREMSVSTHRMSVSALGISTASTERTDSPAHTCGRPGPVGSFPRHTHVSAPPESSPIRTLLETVAPQGNSALFKRVIELELSLEQARSALVANETSVDVLQSTHKELEEKYATLRVQSDNSRNENGKLSAVVKQMEEQRVVQIDTQQSIQEELELAQRLLAERTRELTAAQLELNARDTTIHELRQNLSDAKFEVDEARIMLQAERSEREEVSAELVEAIKEQENAWKTAGFYKEELDAVRVTYEEEMRASRAKLEDELEAARAKYEEDREEIDKKYAILQRELETCDRKLCVEEMRAYRAEELMIPRLEERIEQLTILLREATGELSTDESRRSRDSAVNTVVDQETDLIALRRTVDAKDIELKDVTYQFDRHKRVCRRDMSELREDVVTLQTEVKGLRAELATTKEEAETHRSRAADYFQRNKTCQAELDRLKLIGHQWKNELDMLRQKAAAASITEVALEKRIAHLDEERALLHHHALSKDFEVSMLRRQSQSSQPVSPLRNKKRSMSRGTVLGDKRSPIVSRLKDRDSPSPTNKKLRLKRAVTSPMPARPSKAFPGEPMTSMASPDGRGKDTPLTPTAKHNSVSPDTESPTGSGSGRSGSTPPSTATTPTKSSKVRTHSVPLPRPRSVLLSTRAQRKN